MSESLRNFRVSSVPFNLLKMTCACTFLKMRYFFIGSCYFIRPPTRLWAILPIRLVYCNDISKGYI